MNARHAARVEPSSRKKNLASNIVGAAGELLISAGVLVVLFLVWQLWWSDIQSAQAQAALQEDVAWIVPLDQLPPGSDAEHDPGAEAPPALALPEGEGELFATLLVPAWGDDYQRTVHQGVNKREVLDPLGIGHFRDTAGPGEPGNFALAAHRTTFGRPFHNMHDLAAGDAVVVRTEQAWYIYRITVGPYIVDPHQVGVVAEVPFLVDDDGARHAVPTGAEGAGAGAEGVAGGGAEGAPGSGDLQRLITLVACHPLYSARERIVVHGELESWQPASAGVPEVLLAEGAVASGPVAAGALAKAEG